MEAVDLPNDIEKRPSIGDIYEGRQSNLDKLVTLIQKEPQSRTDFECSDFVPFLRKQIEWFSSIRPEYIRILIKNCKYLKCPADTVFIKQGDHGDSMYALLRGVVGIFVMFDTDNEKECLSKVEAAMNKKKFNKNDFGTEVAQKVAGSCIGEVALVNPNCLRTATCMTSTECEFIVIEEELYHVSVKEFIEKEFQDKALFVERNSFFRSWTPRQRNQLIISFKKQTVTFGDRLIKQGADIDGVYFIFKGDMEIRIDPQAYRKQFPSLWRELKGLLPELIEEERPAFQAPHVQRKERLASHKAQQICRLGENESIGALEMILGLDAYIETVDAPGQCELLVLKRAQFDKMFRRKYAAIAVEKLKESLSHKLCLYIYQSDPRDVAFLKYLSMKLVDSNVLQEIRRSKHAKARQGVNIGQEKYTRVVERQDVASLLKRLHITTDSAASMPTEDMSEIAFAKMDKRLQMWGQRTNMNGSKLASLQNSALSMRTENTI